jgi:uncharacterized membrane protein
MPSTLTERARRYWAHVLARPIPTPAAPTTSENDAWGIGEFYEEAYRHFGHPATLRRIFVSKVWDRHPNVRSGDQLTLGERSADLLRNSMGSWPFVFAALIFLAAWMAYNTGVGHAGFDPFPYILLNLVLSCLAALQGAILLIAARRADQISGELATSDHDIDQTTLLAVREIKELTDKVHALTSEVHSLSNSIYHHVRGEPYDPAATEGA